MTNCYDKPVKISIGRNFQTFEPYVIPFNYLFKIVKMKSMYSASTFDMNIRKAINYQGNEDIIVLDFDNGFPKHYWDIFMPYVGFAAPTKSHLIDKGDGKGALERYRVILLLESSMNITRQQHKRIYKNIIRELNIDADRSCTDAARFFYGSNRPETELIFFRNEKYFNWRKFDYDGFKFVPMSSQTYIDIEPYKHLDLSYIDGLEQSKRYECPICAMNNLDPRRHHLGFEKTQHIITCFFDEDHSKILRTIYYNSKRDKMKEVLEMGKPRCKDEDIPIIVRNPHPTGYNDTVLLKYNAALDALEKSKTIYLDIETFSEKAVKYSKEETTALLKDLGYVSAAYKRVAESLSEIALDPLLNKIRIITLGNKDFACPFDMYFVTDEQKKRILNCIKNSFIVGQNLKFDLRSIAAKYGEEYLPQYCFDTLICAKMMHAATDYDRNMMGFSLGALAKYWLDIDMKKDQGDSDWGADNLTHEHIRYAVEDVTILPKLFEKFLTEVIPERYLKHCNFSDYDLSEIAFLGPLVSLHPVIAIEMQFVLELVRIENRGIKPYTKYLEENRESYLEELENINSELGINVKSSQQCVKFLRERVDPNCTSSSKNALADYKDNPFVQKIQKGKSLSTRAGLMTAMLNVHPYDKKLHTQFTQILSTGRMASKHPNMQQIPRTLKEYIYDTDKDELVISADYPAIELRLESVYTMDPTMLKAYAEGQDLHYIMASKMMHKPIPQTDEEKADPNFITKDERLKGKCCNFTLIYGAKEETLVEYFKMYGIKISIEEAAKFRRAFMETYPIIAQKINATYNEFYNGQEMEKEIICADGRRFKKNVPYYKIVQTMLGRVLAVDTPNKALNFPVQGSGADMTKLANCYIGFFSRQAGVRLEVINLVHDDTIALTNINNFDKAKEIFLNGINFAANYILKRLFVTDVTKDFEIMSKDGICMKEQEDLSKENNEVSDLYIDSTEIEELITAG